MCNMSSWNQYQKPGQARQPWWLRLDSIFTAKESSFIGWFAIFFLGTAVLLSAFGLLPSELQEESDGTSFVQSAEQSALSILNSANGTYQSDNPHEQITNANGQQSGFANGMFGVKNTGNNNAGTNGIGSRQGIIPDRLIIPSIDVDTNVRNPTSDDINDLDYELTRGAVRYPGSGTIGNGNMFIFGHSTGFKVVINKAYKVFNDIHTLTKGDRIILKAGNSNYAYSVIDVQKVNKNSTEIKFDNTGNMLTISTCDSFGAKTDRYIVEATYIGLQP